MEIKFYDRVINDQTIEDTPFEKPFKKNITRSFSKKPMIVI